MLLEPQQEAVANKCDSLSVRRPRRDIDGFLSAINIGNQMSRVVEVYMSLSAHFEVTDAHGGSPETELVAAEIRNAAWEGLRPQ